MMASLVWVPSRGHQPTKTAGARDSRPNVLRLQEFGTPSGNPRPFHYAGRSHAATFKRPRTRSEIDSVCDGLCKPTDRDQSPAQIVLFFAGLSLRPAEVVRARNASDTVILI